MFHYELEYKEAYYIIRAPSAFDAFYSFVWKRPRAISSYRVTAYDRETGGKEWIKALAGDSEVLVNRVSNK